MNQGSSVKMLNYSHLGEIGNMPFISFPGAKDCLMDVLEFKCFSNTYPNHYHQLSQICHNIQSLTVKLESEVSDGLKELISSLNGLKSLGLEICGNGLKEIITSLSKHHHTITRIHIKALEDESLSFVASFRNLRELIITSCYVRNELQYMIFPNLQSFGYLSSEFSNPEFLIKFLKNNGKNLIELRIYQLLNLSTVRCYPNIKNLSICIEKDELEM